jgi:bacteriocin biosynthesis cyclodehydratase domain-containing protein
VDDRLVVGPVPGHPVGMAFRPSLRPGAPLLRRDATHLQVGTSPGIVIPDRPGLLPFLRLLDGARDVARLEELAPARCPELAGRVGALLLELRAVGAVVDGTTLARPHIAHEVALQHDAGSAELIGSARPLLEAAGLTRLSSTEPALIVLASHGEPARSDFERATLLGIDHLPVVVDEDRVRIGPLVSPGRTPCVGCHDLHRADWDPAWPALVHQLGRESTIVLPAAVSAVTTHAAAGELAIEVLTHAAGLPTRTSGRCLVVGPAHDARTFWPVAFHPGCSCDLLTAA